MGIEIHNTGTEHFPGIMALCRAVYPDTPAWRLDQLESHLKVFPEGQFVALMDGRVVGMAASLIVLWDDYDFQTNWKDFTAKGTFSNHDPARGHTLYGAEVMVHPDLQGQGVGSLIYQAREDLMRKLGLWRIRAGARLRGYHGYAAHMDPEAYTAAVIRGELSDPTLTFQLKRGFHVLGVAKDYLFNDPESLGYAAVIEKLNPDLPPPPDSPPPIKG